MSDPRRMSRRRALWLSGAAAVSVGVTGGLVFVLARMATHFGGAGWIAGVLSIASLLATVAFFVAVLVLMYALYACVRGPGETAGDDQAGRAS